MRKLVKRECERVFKPALSLGSKQKNKEVHLFKNSSGFFLFKLPYCNKLNSK